MAEETTTPAPTATPSGSLDQQLQDILKRAMIPRTAIGVPEFKPGPRQPYNTGYANTESQGAQKFFQNLGSLVANSVQQQKDKQIQQATGLLQTISNAHDQAQQMVIASGETDPAKIQQAINKQMLQDPTVTRILSDPKSLKQLQKLGKLDLFNPDQKNDVIHEAAKRVGAAGKIKAQLQKIGDLMKAHQQQQQTPRAPEEVLGQIEGRYGKPVQTNAREELSLIGDQIKQAKTQQEADTAAAKLKATQDDFNKKLTEQKAEFETKLAETQKLADMKYKEERYAVDAKTRSAETIANIKARASKDLADMKATQPTMTSRSMGEMAMSVRQHIPTIKEEIDALDKQGKLGVIAGRYEDFMAGKVGADDPAFQRLRTDLSFMSSAAVRTHFGARGGMTMYNSFKKLWDTAGQSANNMKAALDSADDWMKTYEEMGKGELPDQQKGGATKKGDPLGIL